MCCQKYSYMTSCPPVHPPQQYSKWLNASYRAFLNKYSVLREKWTVAESTHWIELGDVMSRECCHQFELFSRIATFDNVAEQSLKSYVNTSGMQITAIIMSAAQYQPMHTSILCQSHSDNNPHTFITIIIIIIVNYCLASLLHSKITWFIMLSAGCDIHLFPRMIRSAQSRRTKIPRVFHSHNYTFPEVITTKFCWVLAYPGCRGKDAFNKCHGVGVCNNAFVC